MIFFSSKRRLSSSLHKKGKVLLLLVILLSFVTQSALAQRLDARNVRRYMDSLEMPIADTVKLKFAYAIALYYNSLPGKIQLNRDSAIIYTDKAIDFAKKAESAHKATKLENSKACLLLLYKRFKEGIPLFRRSVAFFEANNYPKDAADGWFWAVRFAPRVDGTFEFLVDAGERALAYFTSIKDEEKSFQSLAHLSMIHFKMGELDKAESEMEAAILRMEAAKYSMVHAWYHQLSYIARYKGNYAKALHFDLEAVRKLVLPRDSSYAKTYYLDLADLYYNLGPLEKQREYILKGRQYFQGTTPLSYVMQEATLVCFRDSNYSKAVEIILTGIKKHPPQGVDENYNVNCALSTLYANMKQYSAAEKHYLKVLEAEKEFNRGMDMDALYNYYNTAKFYCDWGKFEKAEPFLNYLASVPPQRAPMGLRRETSYLQYRTDSAKGNYLQAIGHLQKFKQLYDIIYSTTKSWQLQELTVKYETDLKEQRLKVLSDSNIYQQARLRILNDSMVAVTRQREINDLKRNLELTTKNRDLRLLQAENILSQARVTRLSDSIANTARLRELESKQQQLVAEQKEQNIKLLTSQAELDKRKLSDAQLRQKLIIAGIILLLLLCAALGYFYWLKQKNSRQIQATNRTLKRLVEEKEWLLKEVHHRVKNNLHTVVSLLESQSTFLSDDALAAVASSQNRVYTMSLIHQKLYTSENITEVDMSVYLPELIQYLEQSFEVRNRIKFNHEIDPVHLSGSLAVPVGLIVNEAVTNAIKYAFANTQFPSIHIALREVSGSKIKLCVSDNGCGISQEALLHHRNSLGLTLIQGLANDIGGELSIVCSNGTSISVVFDLISENIKNRITLAEQTVHTT